MRVKSSFSSRVNMSTPLQFLSPERDRDNLAYLFLSNICS